MTTTIPSIPNVDSVENPATAMDRMYRLQRHFYDFTRRYYLFGRDRLITEMPVSPGSTVLEVGCGTGRNLVLMARKHPASRFFGVDAANVMIDTARAKVRRRHMSDRITLVQGLAENLDPGDWFGVPAFDRIVFSYSLSMIPTWPAAIEAAISNLKPDGEIWIVDFWDQAGYPRFLASLLKSWLRLFHVHHRPELLEHLQKLQWSGRGRLDLDSIGRRYAYLARFTPRDCGTAASSPTPA